MQKLMKRFGIAFGVTAKYSKTPNSALNLISSLEIIHKLPIFQFLRNKIQVTI